GLQASATIWAEQPKVRIIILSTHDDFASVQRALKLGAIDYLLKPVRPTKLIDLLAQVCADLLAEHLPPEIINSDEQGGGAPPPHEASSLLSADLIQQALDYIRQNHQRPDISLGDVADAVHISPSHLSHLLKARAGVSYKQQLTSLRIEAAKRLLQSTNLSVNAIGERVGYHNATNFYRLFNRETGMTPSEFRRQAGEA
ncbi:MAG: helix-turn-helix domain-containing protein, partial [Oscillochloris sp.]|nr:helix-turn-helix domain-containing protein [Oscillochloris sp.]